MKFKKLGIAVAAAAALGAGMVGQAYADAMAEAEVLIHNFVLTKGGTTPFDVTDFTQLSVFDTLNTQANLTPPGASSNHFASSPTFALAVDALRHASERVRSLRIPSLRTFLPRPQRFLAPTRC